MDRIKKNSEEYMIGRRFGRLIPLKRGAWHYIPSGDCYDTWVCKCDCGNIKTIIGRNLRKGLSKSCGCVFREGVYKKHGKAHTRLYKCWKGIKHRCNNKNDKRYENYGGRGIKYCDEWDEFEPFYEWAISHGYSDDLTIDRIDVNGNYCPENCRWISIRAQARNRTSNRMITYNGETKCLQEWSEITGIPYQTLSSRLLRYGWTVERAFTQKMKKDRRRKD